jgi:hypothetical protein
MSGTNEKKSLLPGQHEDGDLDFPFSFPLSKPIPAFGKDVTALELREPTGQDAVTYGLLSGGVYGETWISLLTELTGVPKESLLRMTAKDTMKVTRVLAGFFAQAAD